MDDRGTLFIELETEEVNEVDCHYRLINFYLNYVSKEIRKKFWNIRSRSGHQEF